MLKQLLDSNCNLKIDYSKIKMKPLHGFPICLSLPKDNVTCENAAGGGLGEQDTDLISPVVYL